MLEITIELWNTEITNVVGKSAEGGTVYYWHNKETKKWYLGDERSRKSTFCPSSAMNCGSKYYINKLYKNTTKVT